jgi:catechol 2,3-dioxygenase-like lactoylglutathione lyase family enzyme
MGILEAAAPAIVVCTRDRDRATAFYRDVLGLRFIREDRMAAVFELGGVELRISTVPDFTPHGHTMLGLRVPDVAAAVTALRGAGAVFLIFEGFQQDGLGILTPPGTDLKVAWLKDPDGNILSVTNA